MILRKMFPSVDILFGVIADSLQWKKSIIASEIAGAMLA